MLKRSGKILFSVALLWSVNAGAASKGQFREYLLACAKVGTSTAQCESAILKMLRNGWLWGDVNTNFHVGSKIWQDSALSVQLQAELPDAGEFRLEKDRQKYRPVLVLSNRANPLELLITINHELVHFANSEKLLASILVDQKLPGKFGKKCMSERERTMLLNEGPAFLSEINFWKVAPVWFKKKVQKREIMSKILEKKVTYLAYYQDMEKNIKKHPNFIAQRYMEMGRFPQCSLQLLH